MTEVLCGSTDIGCGDAFDFLNCVRNMTFESMGVKAAMMKSTDTTDDLLMNADSRATAGNIIADKHCEKVHKLTDSIYVCGAGTAADLNQVELNTGKKARVITALWRAKQHLFSYMAYLLIGGVDPTGPHLYQCSANRHKVSLLLLKAQVVILRQPF
uniref:Uncharacterized protein n=1 Tax=Wuchereria bancrofti TaxID=6293 RepID=A0A1I8EJ38_WUCBA